jgi:hypothetical protein
MLNLSSNCLISAQPTKTHIRSLDNGDVSLQKLDNFNSRSCKSLRNLKAWKSVSLPSTPIEALQAQFWNVKAPPIPTKFTV